MPEEKISSWDDWTPEAYLQTYYSELQPDEVATIRFLVDRMKEVPDLLGRVPTMIEAGSGPTLHHIFPAVPYVDKIIMADYLGSNLSAIQSWIDQRPGSHNWTPFVEYTLQREEDPNPTIETIMARENLTRRRISELIHFDAGLTDPLGIQYRESFPLVLSCYCADSATDDQEIWERYMRNIGSLVAPGGIFILAALRKTTSYKVGDRLFPSANIDEEDIRRVLSLDFNTRNTIIEVNDSLHHEDQGYTGIVLARAIKST